MFNDGTEHASSVRKQQMRLEVGAEGGRMASYGKDLIFRLSGKLMEELGSEPGNTLKGRVPKKIARRIREYNQLIRAADYNLLVMLAHSDLMWKNSIRSMSSKSEEDIQNDLGVDVFDQSRTEPQIWELRTLREQYQSAKDLCKSYRLIALGTYATSPENLAPSSKPIINGVAVDQLLKSLARNVKMIDRVLDKFDAINSQLENAIELQDFWRGVTRGT